MAEVKVSYSYSDTITVRLFVLDITNEVLVSPVDQIRQIDKLNKGRSNSNTPTSFVKKITICSDYSGASSNGLLMEIEVRITAMEYYSRDLVDWYAKQIGLILSTEI